MNTWSPRVQERSKICSSANRCIQASRLARISGKRGPPGWSTIYLGRAFLNWTETLDRTLTWFYYEGEDYSKQKCNPCHGPLQVAPGSHERLQLDPVAVDPKIMYEAGSDANLGTGCPTCVDSSLFKEQKEKQTQRQDLSGPGPPTPSCAM